MGKILIGNQVMDPYIDAQQIIDKVKAAQNGEHIPGVTVMNLPSAWAGKAADPETTASSLLPVLLLGAIGFVLLRPNKKWKSKKA